MAIRRAGARHRVGAGARRLARAWRRLAAEQRVAAAAALALLVTMFLPWYSTSSPVSRVVNGRLQAADAAGTKTALFVFSWVEAAVLVVCVAVLAMLFARGERRAFHLPKGDGWVLTAAGAWTCVLIAWRLFDRPDLGRGIAVGIHWGIFVALGAAAALAYAGNRVRARHVPEPPLRRRRAAGEGSGDGWPGRGAPRGGEPGHGGDVQLSDERPHLADTEVLGADPTERMDPPIDDAERPPPPA